MRVKAAVPCFAVLLCATAPVACGRSGGGGTGTPDSSTGTPDADCWHLLAADRVRVLPAPGKEQLMLGSRIVGSNESATNGFVDLATISQAPAPGQWTELTRSSG